VEGGYVRPFSGNPSNLLCLSSSSQEIKGDGNCLFRSFADQLFGDEWRHPEVRQAAIDVMEANRDHYQVSLNLFTLTARNRPREFAGLTH